jgi:TetR/AcrR family transcriptional repressor of nem operon
MMRPVGRKLCVMISDNETVRSLLWKRLMMSKGELTKKRIVAQAAPIFNRNGFAGTSLSDLMTATGLQKGGIYRHFRNKEELAAAAFDHAWALASQMRWFDIDRDTNAIDQLRQFVANFIDKRADLVQGGCPAFNAAVDSDDGNEVLREKARDAVRQWLKRLRSIVSAGIRRGEIRNDADPNVTATVVVSALEGALVISRLERSDQALDSVRSYLDEFLQTLENERTVPVQR